MKITRAKSNSACGYALMIVLVFLGVSSLMLAGVMDWISTRSRLTSRHQAYQFATAAAESAVHKALSSMTDDFINDGEAQVNSRLNTYARMVPDKQEHSVWGEVAFFDDAGAKGRQSVQRTETWRYGALRSRYQGLQGYYAGYRITASTALEALPGTVVAARAQYDLQFADIPVFACLAYSASDLEFTPAVSQNLAGRIHANGTVYAAPDGVALTFSGDVTAGHEILTRQNPQDPVERSPGSVSFSGKTDERARHLKLPMEGLHTPAVLRALVEAPPQNEKASSLTAKQRFYNKAELIITLSESGFKVTSGNFNNFTRSVPASIFTNFISTNVFFDKRESRLVRSMDLNVGRFTDYSLLLRLLIGREIKTVYLDNRLPDAPQSMNAIRARNGEVLPSGGLTLASPNPAYIWGHYNAPNVATRGTTNTGASSPAAIVADAVTILSVDWKDERSNNTLASRKASSTTVNAAVITGIVPTGGGFYSGGFENYLRLLEDWRGIILTYNGAIAIFYPSVIAAAPWGALDDVYLPPVRNFSWDGNFASAAKLPPGTPFFRTVIIAEYTVLPATPPAR